MILKEELKREVKKNQRKNDWSDVLIFGAKILVNSANMQCKRLDKIKICITEEVVDGSSCWNIIFRGFEIEKNFILKPNKFPDNEVLKVKELEIIANLLKKEGFTNVKIITEFDYFWRDYMTKLLGELDLT